ncbi:hypothetical protein BDW59DRAFT_145099 [Aspergillus cavernicola]|uniref:Mid2 domain-containing protein n=1 Tax=Aspergillus cavernicola TaxID=176166 RepID=A0ABR4IG25_9EURO
MARYCSLLALLPGLLGMVTALCYYPNGVSDSNPVYGGCVLIDGETSMCCALNRENPYGGLASNGNTADRCMINGLCKNVLTMVDDDDEQVSLTTYWRGMCTSSEWPEENCLDICSDGNLDGITPQITPCDGTDNSTEWCCGRNNTCCGTSSAITIAPVITILPPSSASATTSSLTTTSTASNTTDPTSDSQLPSSSSSLSTGAQAGIGVGAAVGVIAILGAFLLFWMSRRKRIPGVSEADKWDPYNKTPRHLTEVGSENIHELNERGGMRHELPAVGMPIYR